MVVYGVEDQKTGKPVDFTSNPTNLFPTEADAQKALDNKNGKVKEGGKEINGKIVVYTVNRPVIAKARR